MTRRGLTILGTGFAIWGAGRLLAIRELIQLALAIAVLCLAAAAWIFLWRGRVKLQRSLEAAWVHRGEPLRIDIEVENPERFPTPPLSLKQDLPGVGEPVETSFPALPPRETKRVSYTARPMVRGRFTLPALTVSFADAYGIARKTQELHDPFTLTVYPRIERLPSIGKVTSRTQGDRTRRVPSHHGEDLYGVRPYSEGDDPRKVHWPATARLGNLMVREDEAGGQQMVTIFLDDRRRAYATDEDFEDAVDVAASVLDLFARSGYVFRLICARNIGVGFGRGSAHYHRILEELAIIRLRDEPGVGIFEIARRHAEGMLVAVFPNLDADDLRSLSRAASRYQEIRVVLLSTEPQDLSKAVLRRAGATVISVASAEALPDEWLRSLTNPRWAASAPI